MEELQYMEMVSFQRRLILGPMFLKGFANIRSKFYGSSLVLQYRISPVSNVLLHVLSFQI